MGFRVFECNIADRPCHGTSTGETVTSRNLSTFFERYQVQLSTQHTKLPCKNQSHSVQAAQNPMYRRLQWPRNDASCEGERRKSETDGLW